MVDRGWDQRRVLERHLAQGRTGLGILLALLLAAYSGQRLLGASRRAVLRRRLPLLWRQVLHPDLPTMARAALPSFGAALLLLLIALPLAARFGTIEVLVMVLLSNRWIRRLAPVENIASARSAATARRAFALQAGREAARAFPAIQAIVPEAASFAAPLRGKSSDPAIDNPDLEPDVGNIEADVFELVDLLEGRLHLIAANHPNTKKRNRATSNGHQQAIQIIHLSLHSRFFFARLCRQEHKHQNRFNRPIETTRRSRDGDQRQIFR